ncbi:very short patch repair endonuclease [Streptomyces buecherae]|uniref:very short patch repair endonuclease n=1 Tax=Streptomyces buecherae TaxID=2763006 RepID=UPI0027E3454E|nr:very short patch repair endonuclease [Streptomyces buecherae]
MTAPTSRAQSGWKHDPPPDRAWKGRPGRARSAIAAEQDRAAGGRHRRSVDLGKGRFARASVELKVLPDTRRIRAYLRWSDGGKSPARYLGQVEHDTRAANLAEGWKMAWEKGLLTEEPPAEGSWASSPSVRAVMRANRSKDTRPELRLRSLLHKQGLRYRVAARPLPELRRTADLIFAKPRVAVFVDGCFWHGCPEHLRESHKNAEFWRAKIEGNQARDTETDRLLREAGWTVVRVWEHEDSDVAAARVIGAVRGLPTAHHEPD